MAANCNERIETGPSELPPLTAGTVGCWNALDKAKVKKIKKDRETETQRETDRQGETKRANCSERIEMGQSEFTYCRHRRLLERLRQG